MSPITETLQAVASLIEATYDHDEAGNRTNMDSPMSGADIAAELFNMEGAVFDALAESKAAPDLRDALQRLVDDLTDADEDHNVETGEVYSSVANARDVLAETRGETTCEASDPDLLGVAKEVLWLGTRLHHIAEDPDRFYAHYEAMIVNAKAAIAKTTEA